MTAAHWVRAIAGTACCLSIAAVLAAQNDRLTATAISVAPKATVAVPPRPAASPVRQGDSLLTLYPALRGPIAAAFRLAPEKLPMTVDAAPDLSKVGNMVTIKPLGPHAHGFGLRATHVNIERRLNDPHHYLYPASNPQSSETVELNYDVDHAPAGRYVFVVRSVNQEFTYAISDGNYCTPLAQLPKTGVVAFQKTVSGWFGIGLRVPVRSSWHNPVGEVEIMRVVD